MWTNRRETLADGRGLSVGVDLGSRPASFAEVIRAWREDASFVAFFGSLLAQAPYRAFRWETPPVSIATANRPFEFVLLDSPGLARRPDPVAFAEHLGPETVVATFPNIGGDAILVVPGPISGVSAYGHLASFVREAPATQRAAFWRAVGEAMNRRISEVPVWLNTAGAGVSWLHARLDDRPKYYGFAPYRRPA